MMMMMIIEGLKPDHSYRANQPPWEPARRESRDTLNQVSNTY